MHNCAKRLLQPTPNFLTPLNALETNKIRLKTAPDTIAGPVEVKATIPVVNTQTKKMDTSPLQLFETKKLDQTNICFITSDIVAVCV